MRRTPGPRLLAVIPQCPLDPTSGAARSIRSVAELLARNGWDVRFVATTGSEAGLNLDASRLRELFHVEATFHPPHSSIGPSHLTFTHGGVSYSLLDSEGYSIDQARVFLAADLDALVSAEAAAYDPEVLVTYGSSEEEVRRRAKLRAQGMRVVFFLGNLCYFHERSFAEVDAILTPSRFLSEAYVERSGVHSSHLPPCVCLGEVLAPCVEPVLCTLINPSVDKGLAFFLEIVRIAGARRPEIPFLAVESRGSGDLIGEVGRSLGVDLEKANLHIAKNTSQPRQIYSVTRILLAPSIGPDAGPRVVAEAQLNGIPVIASDRGALIEMVGSGGFVLPVTDQCGGACQPHEANLWFELICRLYDDSTLYQAACRSSYAAASRYRTGEIDRMYVEFFRRVLYRESDTRLRSDLVC